MIRRPPRSTRPDTLFPYTTLFRSQMSTTLNDGFRDWLKANFGTATPSIAAVIAHRMGHDTQSLETADGEHIRALGCSATFDCSKDAAGNVPYHRSEERRVGKECVSTCRARWSPVT